MGCWNETCAITNTPIRPGDKCYVVRINREVAKHGLPRHFGSWRYDWDCLESIDIGTYDDYGWLEESEDPDDLIYIPGGKSIDNRDRCFKVFVHESVWLAIQNHPLDPYYEGHLDDIWKEKREQARIMKYEFKEPPNGHLEFVRVVLMANSTRRDILAGHRFSGMQHYAPAEYRLIMAETEKIVSQIEKDWKEWHKE